MRSRRNRIGTNQYKVKQHGTWKRYLAVYFIGLILVIAFAQHFKNEGARVAYADAYILSPVPDNFNIKHEAVEVEEVEITEERKHLQSDIESYIRTIFGKDAKVAIAVSKNECSPKHRDYPSCVLHTSAEYSVGLFQINLYNSNHWIHAGKVPGETMEEKIEWLKDPYHNTLIAFKIFQDSGFNPWTAYTSGNYLKDL